MKNHPYWPKDLEPNPPIQLKSGDKLALHKYEGQIIPLEKLTLAFYLAESYGDEDEAEQLSMAIEGYFKNTHEKQN